jgi:hypothetical protein
MVEIKGSVVLDSVTGIIRRDGERGYQEMVAQLDAETKKLFQTTISASSWYSLDLFLRFVALELRRTAGGDEQVLVARSEKVVERQLRGMYKIFVKLGSPEFLMKRIAAVHMTYFTGVKMEFTTSGPRGAVVRFTGFAPEHRLIGFTLIGFFRKALELSGAKECDVRFTKRIEDAQGYAELTVNWK